MIDFEDVIKKSGLHPLRVINIYLFGSRCYGTNSEKSDYDFIIIAKTPWPEKEIIVDNYNIHILSMDRFKEGLKQHDIGNIECLFSPFKMVKENIEFEFNQKGLRHSISHISSNSWVKAKKKIAQNDNYIGIKSLFHSIRIPMFGIQLLQNGVIEDWSCANYIWDELNSKEWTWEELDLNYRELRNKTLTNFRKLTKK